MKSFILFLVILSCILYACEKKEVPTVTTAEVTNITGTTASSGGTIITEGTSTVLTRGVCWSTGTTPTIMDNKTTDGAGAGTFTSNITELDGATTYYVRGYATNSEGAGYGMTMSFTTLGQVPSASTLSATNISITGATLRGTVNANYISTIVTFEYGTTTSYGNTITPSQSPVTGHTNTYVSADITGLITGTPYHFRIMAVNSLGTTYGTDLTFIPVLSDVDGNQYKTITIGSQVWMAENLKTTKYNNNSSIPNVTSNTGWSSLVTGAYCFYNNDILNKATYGALYNWYAVNTGILCPSGWHMPSISEWTTLEDYLGGNAVVGGKLKEAGLDHWASPNTGATNESGFTALPGGYRNNNGIYYNGGISGSGNEAEWYSSSEQDTENAWLYYVYTNSTADKGYNSKKIGLSIRCIKD